jgi:hypothetical protein
MSMLRNVPTDVLLNEIRDREVHEDEAVITPFDEQEIMSHALCVKLAAEYMNKRSSVVLPEFYTWNNELPDVMAFNRDYSTVIECKVSRADFLRDAKKSFRLQPNSGMGDFRYYVAPKGLIKPEELPYRWGLIEILPNGKLRKNRDAIKFIEKNIKAEYHALFYYARRANYAGVHNAVLEYRGFDK